MSPIPWLTILKHAPTVVAAAERLLANTRSNRFNEKAQGIEARIDALETASRDSAHLLQDMAQQIQALAAGQQDLMRRTKVAVRVAAVAVILAVIAGVLVIVG